MANPNYQTYGSGKYLNILFDRAGAINVAQDDFKGYQTVSPEKILTYNPDIILVQDRYSFVYDELKNDTKLSSLKAIQNDEIYLLPEYVKTWGYLTAEAMGLGEFYIGKKTLP
ncbi:MAG: ABC transporter substrate-binding protein [Campylobacter sp.]|nr:ABC transporter substrate-binding protein [Campylobacter sp.]